MTKKIGISFIIFFTIFFVVLILNEEYLIQLNSQFFIFSVASSAAMIILGIALISISSNPVKRNRIKKIYLYISIFLILTGVTIEFMGWRFGEILSIGIFWYCFAFAPLELKHKYLKWLPYSKNKLEIVLLSSVDFIGINAIALGVVFKLMHWPGQDYLLVVGAIVLTAGLLSWNYKFKKEVVNRKKSEDKIKEQFNEIQDSINYAKRIQGAILPPLKLVKQYLKKSFILYKPKDIVAGDFYWMEHQDNKLLFAAADCTGHGVPGALVSVICNNGLNRSVREHGLTCPGQILDKTREIVIQEFEKSEEEVMDGMDIALCSLDGNKLQYAGAYNPLWIIRKGGEEVKEIKANRQPIGKSDNPLPFTTHTIELKEGDTIYIFSDGFVDQFGGEKGKKFKTHNFKNLLLSIQNESMEKQKQLIDNTFETWRGEIEQVDDVCVIGMRF